MDKRTNSKVEILQREKKQLKQRNKMMNNKKNCVIFEANASFNAYSLPAIYLGSCISDVSSAHFQKAWTASGQCCGLDRHSWGSSSHRRRRPAVTTRWKYLRYTTRWVERRYWCCMCTSGQIGLECDTHAKCPCYSGILASVGVGSQQCLTCPPQPQISLGYPAGMLCAN